MSTDLKTWSRFSKMINGTEVNFRIQEVAKENYEKVLDMFMEHYVPEEPIHKAAEISSSTAALNELKQIMLNIIINYPHQIDLCCLDDGSEELKLIGGSIMAIARKEDPPLDVNQIKVQTNELKNFYKIIYSMIAAYDIIKDQNVDSYFAGGGVVVHRKYRGLGIAGEILKARIEACKAYNLPLTSSWMTAFGTQKAAAKLGWETVCYLNYEKLGMEAGITFKDGPESCKLMIGRVPT